MHEKRSIIQQIIKAVNLQFSNKLCEKEAILEIKNRNVISWCPCSSRVGTDFRQTNFQTTP